MKVVNAYGDIRVGQLVRITAYKMAGDDRNSMYLVVNRRGDNCELLRVNKAENQALTRRWRNVWGLSVYV